MDEYLDVFSSAELNPKASQATKKVKKNLSRELAV